MRGLRCFYSNYKNAKFFFSKVFYICLINVCFSHLFCGYFRSERFQRLQRFSALSQRGFSLTVSLCIKTILRRASFTPVVPSFVLNSSKILLFSYSPGFSLCISAKETLTKGRFFHLSHFAATLGIPKSTCPRQAVSTQLQMKKSH